MRARNYGLVTGGYWAFTVTDGALRLIVLLHFHELGYSPVSIAFLFLAYEFMGIVTNLVGGWVGARSGLNRTLVGGLALQIAALVTLSWFQASWREWLAVVFVMGLQALSGVAKDLTKMSSKAAVKFIADGQGALFRLVAILTGSKNALKGAGFFVGAALLSWLGFRGALWALAALVAIALGAVLVFLDEDIGKAQTPPKLNAVLSKSDAINRLASARLFLFGARDIWFVVALPIFLDDALGWSNEGIGAFLAAWVIGYGIIQSTAPAIVRRSADETAAARLWAGALLVVSTLIALAVAANVAVEIAIVGGLVIFGVIFAVNSSLHSFLILAYSDGDDVALDVGFYYSANAAGRLVGTLLSGVLFLIGGLALAMVGSAVFVAIAWLLTFRLPRVAPESAPTLAEPAI